MHPMAIKPDDAMQSPIVHLLRIANNQVSNQDSLHCLIKSLATHDKNAINAQSQIGHGNTPLHEAIWCKHSVKTIELCLALGADITKKNAWNTTPLEYACINACPCNDCISYITFFAERECGNAAIVEQNKQKKNTPIHLLMQNNRISDVETLTTLTGHLINAGYSINAQDGAGFTPAHYALIKHNEPTLYLMPLFQKYKADFTIKNNNNQAPFEWAVKYFNSPCIVIVKRIASLKLNNE
jgi:ankyrin repeat protein